jgi:hypothetical protein
MYQGSISRQGMLAGVSRSEFRAAAGETIALQYLARIRSGNLSITVRDPSGSAAWQAIVTEDGSSAITLDVRHGGRYMVVVEGRGADGSLSLSWVVS